MHNLSNDAERIYHILVNCISLMMITIERAHCLYTLLTKASIDFGSFVMSMMMSVLLMDPSPALPYRALITRIVEHAKVSTTSIRELALEKAPIGEHFLHACSPHL